MNFMNGIFSSKNTRVYIINHHITCHLQSIIAGVTDIYSLPSFNHHITLILLLAFDNLTFIVYVIFSSRQKKETRDHITLQMLEML